MKARWYPIFAIALFFALMVAVPSSVTALEWTIAIQPPETGPIMPGGTATVSITGDPDAEIWLEVTPTDDSSDVLERIPATGYQTLQNGIWVFTWDVNGSFLPGAYYLVVRETGQLRTAIAFNIGESGGDAEIAELRDEITRLETWLRLLDTAAARFEDNVRDELRMLWVTTLISLVLSSMAITGAFAERSPALRALFRGERETKENKTYRELGKLLKYFIRREIPSEFGDVFQMESESPPEKKSPEDEHSFFKKICEYCGDDFKARSPLAKYCQDKNCRVLAYKKRQQEKEQGSDE